ncbi:MAG: hypothetical protein WDO24_20050 [Pseudomonadota bacterium]
MVKDGAISAASAPAARRSRDRTGRWCRRTSPPDREHGIGDWTDGQIKRAITQGIDPHERQLSPPMAYRYYARIKPVDLDAIVALSPHAQADQRRTEGDHFSRSQRHCERSEAIQSVPRPGRLDCFASGSQ